MIIDQEDNEASHFLIPVDYITCKPKIINYDSWCTDLILLDWYVIKIR